MSGDARAKERGNLFTSLGSMVADERKEVVGTTRLLVLPNSKM